MARSPISVAALVGAGVVSGGVAPVTQIPWTPAMVSAWLVTEAVETSTLQDGSGNVVSTDGGLVKAWNDTSGNAKNLTSTAGGVRGSAVDASPTGVIPVKFTDVHALNTPNFTAGQLVNTIFLLARFRAVPAGNAVYALGHSNSTQGAAGAAYQLLQSSGTATGALRVWQPDGQLEQDNTERLRIVTINNPNASTGTTSTSRKNGSATSVTATGLVNTANDLIALGNKTANRTAVSGARMDVFAFAVVPSSLSRANEQRMEGYLAHRAGLQATLEDGHPYKAAPPMVPEGTTSTLGLFAVDRQTAGQTYMGGYIEIQPDSFNGGSSTPAIDGATDTWGFPQSLTPSEQVRLRQNLFPGGGVGLKYIRFPLGFAYRGGRVIDDATGLIKQIGERYAGQNAAIASLLANVVAEGGGLMPEYWSPAPYWKTTGKYGGGELWAGGGYSRTTKLQSIRTSDVTQFNAQVAAFTDAIINDLEYLHQNVAPVRGFGLQNEPVFDFVQNYGTCGYDSATMVAVLKSLIPKIRNSAILSTYSGQPNTVLLHHNSWEGFDPASEGGLIVSDATVLSTGKTALQEMWAGSRHDIENISADAEYLRVNAGTWRGYAAKPNFINEFEYFTPGDHTDQWRCANSMLKMVYELRYLQAPVVMPIIHVAKQLGQSSSESNTIGYALAKVRLPAPYGEDPSTPGDSDPAINYGEFGFVAPNYNAWRFIADNVPHGSVRRTISGTAPSNIGITALTKPDGKLVLLLANRTASAADVTLDLSASAILSGKRYDYQSAGAALPRKGGAICTFSLQPYSGEAWAEV